jgi:NADPH-dependent ferric siderophore reductase
VDYKGVVSTPLPVASAPARRKKLPPKFHYVTISSIEELTPRMRRITFSGADLATYPNDGPGTHFKILLPQPGLELVLPEVVPPDFVWPSLAEGGPIRRTFTPRFVDNENSRLVIDFALHEHGGGPASQWASRAVVGDTTVLTGGRGAYRIDPAADWALLVGDETALPAIGTLLEDAAVNAPGVPIHIIVEVGAEDDEIPLPLPAGATLTWVRRGDRPAGAAATDAVTAAELASGAGKVWVGLEASAMRDVRRHLLHERGLDRSGLHTRAYWKYGAGGHPDSDSGEDVD